MTALVITIVVTLAVSFACSLMESVILSVTHGYIESLRKTRRHSSEVLKGLKDRIDRPLAAILTFNTIANTAGATAIGAQVLALYRQAHPEARGGEVVAATSALMTLMILVFSEITPKTLGAVYWRRLAPAVGYVIWALVGLAAPVVWLFELLSRRIAGRRRQPRVSREEMLAVAELGKAEGTLLTEETRVIQNLLRLNKIRALDVLTPRNVLVAFQKDKTVQEVLKRPGALRFSRFLLYGKDLDEVVGRVHRHQLARAVAEGRGSMKLTALARAIHAVPETKSVASILDEMIRRREHLFLVVDEYGGTAGIITLEDAIETLLGVEIVDEFDTVASLRKAAARMGQERRERGLR